MGRMFFEKDKNNDIKKEKDHIGIGKIDFLTPISSLILL